MGFIGYLKKEFSFLKGNYLVLIVSWILMHFADPIAYIYHSLFVLELGATPYILGLINSLSTLSFALVQFIGGYIADYYGRRKIIVLMTFGLAFSNLFFVFAENWLHILFGSIFGNIFLVYSPALSAITADSIPPEKRGLGFSLSHMIVIVSVFSPLIASFLVVNYGIVYGVKLAYLIVFIFYIISAIIRTRLKETLPTVRGSIGSYNIFKVYVNAVYESFSALKFASRDVIKFLLITVVLDFSMRLSMPFFVVYAKNVIGLSEGQWAILMTLYYLSSSVSGIFIGKIIDVFGRKNPLILACFLQTITLIIFIHGSYTTLIPLFILWALFDLLMMTSRDAMNADLIPRNLRGRLSSVRLFFEYVAMSLGYLIGGYLYEHISPQYPFILNIVFAFVCAIALLILIAEPIKREL
ncbi:MAG: MFS transporter [Candidatus Methanomethylicia archaeon]